MRMVTKKIKTTFIATKCIDTQSMEIVDRLFTIEKPMTDEVLIARKLNKILANTPLKLVKIVDFEVHTYKYGMELTEFLDHATIMG